MIGLNKAYGNIRKRGDVVPPLIFFVLGIGLFYSVFLGSLGYNVYVIVYVISVLFFICSLLPFLIKKVNFAFIFDVFISIFILIYSSSFFSYLITVSINSANASMYIYFSALKFLLLFFIYFWGIKLKILIRDFMVIAFFAFILFFSYFLNYVPFSLYAVYLLNSFFPTFFLFFLLKYLLQLKSDFFISRISLNIAYLIAFFFGIFLLLFPQIWKELGVDIVYLNRGFELTKGYPKPWWLFVGGKNLFLRFNGIFKDPIIWGYFSVFVFLVNFERKNFLFSILPFIGVLMAFSKGAFLLVFLSLFFYRIKCFVDFISQRFIFFVFMLLLFVFLISIPSVFVKTSLNIHFLGFVLPFLNIFNYSFKEMIFGHGIGSGGNLALAFGFISRSEWLLTGSESGVGVLFYQLGFTGLFLYLYLFYFSIKNVKKPLSKFLIFFYTVNLFLQENLINASYVFFLILAVLLIEKRTGGREVNVGYRRTCEDKLYRVYK